MHFDIDLKLLKILHTLVICGSITKCAKTLGLTPGSISYSINKIRAITGGRLFVRTKKGMLPDAMAMELSRRYLHYLAKSSHQPASEKHTLRIHTHSLLEMMFSDIAMRDDATAPYCYDFRAFMHQSENRLDMLRRGYVDIDIGARLPYEENIHAVKLFSASACVLMSQQNALKPEAFTIDDWMSRPHARTVDCDDFYFNDIPNAPETKRYLEHRDFNTVSGCVINMIAFCSSSEYIALIPDFYAPFVTQHFPVICVPAPPEIALTQDCFLHYHANFLRDPDVIKRLVSQLLQVKNAMPTPVHAT